MVVVGGGGGGGVGGVGGGVSDGLGVSERLARWQKVTKWLVGFFFEVQPRVVMLSCTIVPSVHAQYAFSYRTVNMGSQSFTYEEMLARCSVHLELKQTNPR